MSRSVSNRLVPNVVAILALMAGAAVCVGAPAPARADSAEAKVFERKGKQAYAKKRWEEAAAAFTLAFEAEAVPKYLFNAAKAFEQGGDLPQAIDLLQRYVAAETDGTERADGKAQLKILQTRLKGSHGRVSIASTPPGAQVLVEGSGPVRAGLTPWKLWLPAGQWKVRIIKAGYQALEHDLITQAGAGASLNLKLRKPKPAAAAAPAAPKQTTGKLRLSVSEPEGAPAKLHVDGEAKGVLPKDVDLTVGRHLVEVSRKGHRPWSKWIELEAGEDRMLELALAKAGDDDGGGAGAALPAAVGLGALGMAAGALGAMGGAAQGAGGAGASAAGSAAGGAVGGAPGAGTAGAAGAGAAGQAAASGQAGGGGASKDDMTGLPGGAGQAPSATQGPVPAKKSMGEQRAESEGLGRLPSSTAIMMIHTLGGSAVTTVSGEVGGVKFEDKSEGDIEENTTGVGFRFGDLISPFVDIGASLFAYVHNTEDGTDVNSHTFALTPFLRIRVPLVPGPHGDMVEAYGMATGGLLIDSLTDEGRKKLKANGIKADDINFGWTVAGAVGAQFNLTRNFGLYAEGGFERSQITLGINEIPAAAGTSVRVTDGKAVGDQSRPFAGAGLIFLN